MLCGNGESEHGLHLIVYALSSYMTPHSRRLASGCTVKAYSVSGPWVYLKCGMPQLKSIYLKSVY